MNRTADATGGMAGPGWKARGELVKRLPLWNDDDRVLDLHLPIGLDRNDPPMTVVCLAGGGYGRRAWHEGPATVLWLAMHGFAAVDVPYTTAEDLPEPARLHPRPLRDACRAIRVVRDHAEQFGLSAERVAVLGYSAGGHLAGSVALLHAETDASDDLAPTWSGRPDAAAMIYPVVSMVPPCHEGSARNLLGAGAPLSEREGLSLQRRVTAGAPPLFIAHSADDASVPVAGAMDLTAAYLQAALSVESHIFPTGGHGYGLALQDERLGHWPALLKAWLRGVRRPIDWP